MEAGLKKMMEKEEEKEKEKEREVAFHVIHKVPSGDGPYGRAKQAQLIEKDPAAAIVWFWRAINEGDRVDSALKDMALVMKQLDRAQEAIEAIKSFRGLCPKHAQESLDNVLIDLYKKCRKVDEQIVVLKDKLRKMYLGEAFNGKPTKTTRNRGKRFKVSIKQETSKILGNLGWAYMQKGNYMAAEVVYRKVQTFDTDANKACNLCHCLMKQGRHEEARLVLRDVLEQKLPGSEVSSTRNRAQKLLLQLQEEPLLLLPNLHVDQSFEDDFGQLLERVMNEWAPARSRRLPIFEQISQPGDQLAC